MNLGELYKSFTYDPTPQKHVLIAEPMYKAMTGKPLTAKLEHSNNMKHLGVYSMCARGQRLKHERPIGNILLRWGIQTLLIIVETKCAFL